MKSKHGAMLILWATAALGVLGCDQGDDSEPGAGSSTGMEMDASTGDTDPGADGETGRPTPIPPDPPADDSSDGGMDTSSTGDEPPMELSCEAYCGIYMDACQDFGEYANEQHCLDHCAQWPIGTMADTAGDSLGCRTYHVTVASSTDPQLHCPHAGPSGMHVCVDEGAPDCDLYCTRYFNNCEGDLNLWADMDECMSTCGEWYPGGATDTSGHSIGCRAYYANLAA
ncbi:MAG: hypothetical protein KDK70_22410, partial [Myxococcales bacterium]|nr:hypothetical protein [Myxococcales bacterium]